MNGIAVRPVTSLLIDENRIEKILEQSGVGVDRDGMEGVYDCMLSILDTLQALVQ